MRDGSFLGFCSPLSLIISCKSVISMHPLVESPMLGWLKHPESRPRRLPSLRARRRSRLWLEQLEARNLLAVYTPTQMSHGYQVDLATNPDGSTADGTGQTIAIAIAFDAPNIVTDLQTFDSAFGLPDPPTFTIATPQGQPSYNSGWASEATLDVEWAHAIAPGANILLVESLTNSISNLLGAVGYARNYPGVSVVSMSWGAGELSGETSLDFHFTTPSGQTGGVTFVAASGDSHVVGWPAVSPNVVAVGGTTLSLDGVGNWLNETAWSASGGGISLYESQPDYQAGIVTQSTTKRTNPDVAYNANPGTGVYVRFNNGWYSFGGTSAGAPQWAGIIALADQGLGILGKVSLDGRCQTLPTLYALTANWTNYYHDIPPAGYDLFTGLGSPLTDQIVQGLVSAQSCGGGGGGGSSPHSEPTLGGLVPTPPIQLRPLNVVPVPQPPSDAFSSSPRGERTHTVGPLPQRGVPLAAVQPLVAPAAATLPYALSPSSTEGRGVVGGLPPNSVDRAAVAPLAVDPRSVPVFALPPRVESGAGDKAVLPDDSYDPSNVDSTTSAAALASPELTAAAYRRACTLCFADSEGDGAAKAADQAVPSQVADAGSQWDPVAAAVGLALVLGRYWGRSSSELEMRERRRRDRRGD
jgi:hypothetical protein